MPEIVEPEVYDRRRCQRGTPGCTGKSHSTIGLGKDIAAIDTAYPGELPEKLEGRERQR